MWAPRLKGRSNCTLLYISNLNSTGYSLPCVCFIHVLLGTPRSHDRQLPGHYSNICYNLSCSCSSKLQYGLLKTILCLNSPLASWEIQSTFLLFLSFFLFSHRVIFKQQFAMQPLNQLSPGYFSVLQLFLCQMCLLCFCLFCVTSALCGEWMPQPLPQLAWLQCSLSCSLSNAP